MTMRVILFCAFVGFAEFLAAQDGMLDTTFAQAGVSILNLPAVDYSQVNRLSVSSSGQIIVLSLNMPNSQQSQVTLLALKPNGSIDTNFGNAGWRSILCNNCVAGAVGWDALLHIGKGRIIVATTVVVSNSPFKSMVKVWRLDSVGNIETSFILDILSINDLVDILKQSDDKLIAVVSNRQRIGVNRIDTNGVEDLTFGTNGIATTPLGLINYEYGATITNSDHILVGGAQEFPQGIAGMRGVVYKFLPDGQVDSSFGTNGRVLISEDVLMDVNRLGVLPDGRIIVFGWGPVVGVNWGPKLICLTISGAIDNSFGNSGMVVLTTAPNWWEGQEDILIQPDGKILVFAGHYSNGIFMERYLNNGVLDSTFGNFGRSELILPYSAYADSDFQPDGKIVISGGLRQNGSSGSMDNLMFITARFNSGIPISIEENPVIFSKVLFFPNPFSDHATLQFSLLKDAALTISLVNMLGVKVADLASQQQFAEGENEISIDGFNALPTGQYFVVISTSASRVSIPIIKSE